VEKDKRIPHLLYTKKYQVAPFALHKNSIVSFMCFSLTIRDTCLVAKLLIIREKCGKSLECRTSEIASASLSGTIEQTLVQWSPDLLDLFCHPYSHGTSG